MTCLYVRDNWALASNGRSGRAPSPTKDGEDARPPAGHASRPSQRQAAKSREGGRAPGTRGNRVPDVSLLTLASRSKMQLRKRSTSTTVGPWTGCSSRRRLSSRTRGTLTSPLIYPGGAFRPHPPPLRAVRGAAGQVPVINFQWRASGSGALRASTNDVEPPGARLAAS
jgi:hypothetical protein